MAKRTGRTQTKKNEHAEIEIMYVSQKAHDDDISLAPYVGYEVVVITQPDGTMDFVLDGDIRYNEAHLLDYFQYEKIQEEFNG